MITKHIVVDEFHQGKSSQEFRAQVQKIRSELVATQEGGVMTLEQMQERSTLVESEIEANEEEARVMQQELNALYAKIDAVKS
jgi:hypothetical protein